MLNTTFPFFTPDVEAPRADTFKLTEDGTPASTVPVISVLSSEELMLKPLVNSSD